MAGQAIRLVNIVPLATKIKKEVLSEDEDEEVMRCRICSKGFVSDVALRNHAMMEHFDAFITGDPSNWTDPESVEAQKPKRDMFYSVKIKQEHENDIQQKTEMVLSAMKPGNLMSLASGDVNYIIIKNNQSDLGVPVKRKRLKVTKEVTKSKDPQDITGPFECIVEGSCHRIFFSCCEYSIHYRDEHTRRRKGLRCQVCEKPLSSTEDSQFPYTCDVCGAGFTASKQLSDHTSEAHVKLKPFQCGVCHKRFTQQGGVQQHMRMHTGDRPFACSECPKTFTQKSGLDQHLRIHTKVKPYRCVVCGKSFCQSVHLRQHMRTHTRLAPFRCQLCPQRFKQASHLNYHLRHHIGQGEGTQMEPLQQMVVGELEQVAAEQSIQLVEEYELDDSQHTWEQQA